MHLNVSPPGAPAGGAPRLRLVVPGSHHGLQPVMRCRGARRAPRAGALILPLMHTLCNVRPTCDELVIVYTTVNTNDIRMPAIQMCLDRVRKNKRDKYANKITQINN